MDLNTHGVEGNARLYLIVTLILIIPPLANPVVNAIMTTTWTLASGGLVNYPLPEPGTPYKWLGARVYGEHFGMNKDAQASGLAEANYQKIMQIHPRVIEYMDLCGWFDGPSVEYKYGYSLEATEWLCARAEQDGVFVIDTWGNHLGWYGKEGEPDSVWIGLGPVFQARLEDWLSKLQHRPLYIVLESEYTKPTNGSDIEGTRTELNQCKAICEKYGVRFGLILGYKSEWMIPFNQEFPVQGGTRYPYGGDSPHGMTDVDKYQYGFVSVSGIITPGVEELWTAEAVETVCYWADQAEKLGVIGFDIFPAMLDLAQCPDFIPTVNAEAAARGYVTSLVPPQNFSFTIESSTGGTTDPAAGSYTAPLGSVVAVTATPYQGYVFDHWTLNGVTYTQNPIQVWILANAVLKPYFVVA